MKATKRSCVIAEAVVRFVQRVVKIEQVNAT
jgi:hypothetical protein